MAWADRLHVAALGGLSDLIIYEPLFSSDAKTGKVRKIMCEISKDGFIVISRVESEGPKRSHARGHFDASYLGEDHFGIDCKEAEARCTIKVDVEDL